MFDKQLKITVKLINKCQKVRKTQEFSSPHNPEVVGSSPASATIKTPDFTTKSGVFLTFRGEMNTRKTGVELALELAAESAKKEFRENPTFLGKLGFSY